MSDDWINDPYDEAPVHVLDDDGEPDDADGSHDDTPNDPKTVESQGDSSDSA